MLLLFAPLHFLFRSEEKEGNATAAARTVKAALPLRPKRNRFIEWIIAGDAPSLRPSSLSKQISLLLSPLDQRHERAGRHVVQRVPAAVRPADLDDVRRFRAAQAEEKIVRGLREVRRARAHLAKLDLAVGG